MKKLIMSAALLGAVALAVPAFAAGTSSSSSGQNATTTPAVPEAAAAAKGGVSGQCPEGQVASVNGQCAPGQPSATGTMSGGDSKANAEMPASPHQQEVLKPKPKQGG